MRTTKTVIRLRNAHADVSSLREHVTGYIPQTAALRIIELLGPDLDCIGV